MAKVGIAIDKWKLPIFERHLTGGGYKFVNKGAMPGNTLLLHVDTRNVEALQEVVKAAQAEAAMQGVRQ